MDHPELAYTFRRMQPTVTTGGDADAVLARVDELLVEAGRAFADRRYTEAIALYTKIRSLLWKQLFPIRVLDEVYVWELELFTTFLSYGAEWLNVLPIDLPVTGVRPRHELPNDPGPVIGLTTDAIDADGMHAIADLETAELLRAQGNAKAAEFFDDRATELAPELVGQLELARGALPRARSADVDARRYQRDASDTSGALLAAMETPLPGAEIPPAMTTEARSYAATVGDKVEVIQWGGGNGPDIEELISKFYEPRRFEEVLPDRLIQPVGPADAAVALAHAFYYETPLGLAECHHALGDWETAATWYEHAAGYAYLNAKIEAPYLWSRFAALYRDWGDSLFRADEPGAAIPIYEKVLTVDGGPGTSTLFTITGLKPATVQAHQVIDNLETPDAITASPAIAGVIFDIWAQLAKISGGLDFWGQWTENVPIWTFDYLQSVAANFCQLAIGAERDAMGFWEKAQRDQLTRVQLTQSVALASAEREATVLQVSAAQAELNVYVKAEAAANQRAENAEETAADYEQRSRQWTLHQALAAQLGGGDHRDPTALNALADIFMRGDSTYHGGYRTGTLAAAENLAASRIQTAYELDLLERQAAELDAAAVQAAAERGAASARVAALQAAAQASRLREESEAELLAAFEDQRFTPDVWHALGERMNRLAQRYLAMALDTAKRMQRSYNFENDVGLRVIKADYASESVNGLLAADTLMADIQSFTYDLVTSTAPKPQTVRQTISLAQRHPFLFETRLRRNGRMEFQTTIDDFDSLYPGSYAGRVEHVEVEVDGIVPPRGVSGTLTNSGISHYRVPFAQWQAGTSGLKHRVQAPETLVLSDYDLRTDAIVVDTDRRQRRVFEGAGVVSSWTLELPREVNEIDYGSLIDVRLTFTYQARYDPNLKQRVLTELAGRPSVHERQRPLPLRWLHPDAFFAFYGSGVLDVTLGVEDFAAFEDEPQLNELSLLVVTSPSARAEGLVLQVTGPSGPRIEVATDGDGIVPTTDLSAAAGGDAMGSYRIEIDPDDNPTWVDDGQLDLEAIQNIALVVGYSFTPRS